MLIQMGLETLPYGIRVFIVQFLSRWGRLWLRWRCRSHFLMSAGGSQVRGCLSCRARAVWTSQTGVLFHRTESSGIYICFFLWLSSFTIGKSHIQQITMTHQDLLPSSSLLLAFKLSHSSSRNEKSTLDLLHAYVYLLLMMWSSSINVRKHLYCVNEAVFAFNLKWYQDILI